MYDNAGRNLTVSELTNSFMQSFVESYVAGIAYHYVTDQAKFNIVIDTLLGFDNRFKKLIRQIVEQMVRQMIENADDDFEDDE